ncbi:MAG: hypothetical protein MK371_04825 [SAR86 cluster bacterium]|nr:hypothetical protein [SAR86 cluster bacterium]
MEVRNSGADMFALSSGIFFEENTSKMIRVLNR